MKKMKINLDKGTKMKIKKIRDLSEFRLFGGQNK
jgi:hypothetical protein